MTGLQNELAQLEMRLKINPDDAVAKRRIGDVKAAINAGAAEPAPVIEVVEPEMEVERAELPSTAKPRRGGSRPS